MSTSAAPLGETFPSFDIPTIRGHIALLHSLARGCEGNKFVLCVFNGDQPGTITHHRVGDVDGMVAAIAAQAMTPGANAYVGLHLMRPDLPRGKRGTAKDIVAVLGLVADMDADTSKVGTMPLAPSYVVETSPGNSQPVILFDHPMAPDKARPLAKALQVATRSDSGTGDINHIWRIPGTLNYPNAAKIARGRNAAPVDVTVQMAFAGEVHSEETLVRVLAPFVAEQGTEVEEARFTATVDAAPLWERLSDIGRAMLMADGQPDRSAHAARVIEQLAFEDFTLDEAASLCRDRAGKWIHRYEDEAAFIRDAERVWNKHVLPKEARQQENAEAVHRLLRSMDVIRSFDRVDMPTPPPYAASPFGLEQPGGVLTEIARWIFATSPSPIADFSIMSAVTLYAGLFGRRWLTPDGLGLNLYSALVAGSGFGKDRPLKALSQIADSISRGHLIGPNDIASDSALEFILRQNPCQVLPLDELGMLLSASGKSSDAHARARRKAMLELYSSATSSWVAKVRASDGMNGQTPKPRIQWPTLSFLGATTPSTFYDGLEDDAFRSGFIARLIVVAVDKAPIRQRLTGYPEVPQELIDTLTAAVTAERNSNTLSDVLARDSALKPQYSVARWADEDTASRMDQIRDWARDIGIEDERRGQIVNRAGDHTSKLATIRALSRSAATPVVTVQDVEWAFGIVWRSIQTVEDGADRFMSGSAFESLCKAILEAVRQCKDPKGLKNAELLRKPGVSYADERMIGDSLSRLINGTAQLQNVGGTLGKAGKGGRYRLATLQ
jgi:hypothetical protein